MPDDVCQVVCVHEEKVSRVRREMPPDGALQLVAEVFKLLGEPTRLRLLEALARTEMCVCDLAAVLDSTPSGVSHQLRLLRTAGLVSYRKSGKLVYYRLVPGPLQELLREGWRFARAAQSDGVWN